MLYVSHHVIARGHCCMNRFMSFPRGIVAWTCFAVIARRIT
ncbi:MAG: hypothetical protein ACEY3D_05220 [Rickettsia sp.]